MILLFASKWAATGHEFYFRLEIAPSRHCRFFPPGVLICVYVGAIWEVLMKPRGCGFGVRMAVERHGET